MFLKYLVWLFTSGFYGYVLIVLQGQGFLLPIVTIKGFWKSPWQRLNVWKGVWSAKARILTDLKMNDVKTSFPQPAPQAASTVYMHVN